MAWAAPSQVGDRAADIPAGKAKLRKYEYGRENLAGDDSDVYTKGFGVALRRFQSIMHGEVLTGKRQTPDVNTDGVYDWATKVQLEVIARQTAPKPEPKLRHPAFVFRGTGGVIGLDYVSRICQGVADLVEEINPDWPATMGGIPVGTAGGIGDPSMWRGVQIALADAQKRFLAILAVRPKVKIIIGGYSAGAVAAALFRQWILAHFPEHYLCSFSIGDPTRPAGGGYYPGVATDGQGISSWRYGDIRDWRHCWLAQPGDMYSGVPLGKTGEIMQDAFDMVTQIELSNLVDTAKAIVPVIPEILSDAGIELPEVFKALQGGAPALVSFWGPMLFGALTGLLGGNPNTVTGTAAAAQAALIALKFATDSPPTRPHITYEFGEVWPGQTYLGLAIQHVREYASAVAPA